MQRAQGSTQTIGIPILEKRRFGAKTLPKYVYQISDFELVKINSTPTF